MKNIVVFIITIFIILFFADSILSANDNSPVLKGPYLSQKPPGMTPGIFGQAPDIPVEHQPFPGLALGGIKILPAYFTFHGSIIKTGNCLVKMR